MINTLTNHLKRRRWAANRARCSMRSRTAAKRNWLYRHYQHHVIFRFYLTFAKTREPNNLP